jgi:hypothetical protein
VGAGPGAHPQAPVAPGISGSAAGSCRKLRIRAGVAQLVEQPPCKRQVRGSSPLSGSRNPLLSVAFLDNPQASLDHEGVRPGAVWDGAGASRTVRETVRGPFPPRTSPPSKARPCSRSRRVTVNARRRAEVGEPADEKLRMTNTRKEAEEQRPKKAASFLRMRSATDPGTRAKIMAGGLRGAEEGIKAVPTVATKRHPGDHDGEHER